MLRYDPTTAQLNNNTIYQVDFNLPGIISKSWTFCSSYSPYYSTIKMVRQEGGVVIAGMDNTTVATAIYEASKLCDSLILGDAQVTSADMAAAQLRMKSLYVQTTTKQEFTKYQAAYNLMSRALADTAVQSGSESKKLGSLSIDKKAYSGMDLSMPISYLLKMIAYWQAKLIKESSNTGAIASFVRGGSSNPFPLSSRVF